MAFTPAQLRTIAVILGVTPSQLDLHLNANPYDSDTETAVETELTRWTTAGGLFQSMEPKERNFGVRQNSSDEKDDIRRNIALLLEFDLSLVSTGMVRLMRA